MKACDSIMCYMNFKREIVHCGRLYDLCCCSARGGEHGPAGAGICGGSAAGDGDPGEARGRVQVSHHDGHVFWQSSAGTGLTHSQTWRYQRSTNIVLRASDADHKFAYERIDKY